MASGLSGCELWLVDLDAADWSALATNCLNELERARAARFHFDRDRERFIRSRAALRHVLAQHLGVQPRDVAIAIGDAGKPGLAGQGPLAFNLSHSGAWALIATHPRVPIGIDLELPGRQLQLESLIAQTLDLEERAQMPQHDEATKSAAFTRLWVRKEACLKATGLGLQVPLPQVNVASRPASASSGGTTVRLGTTRWQLAWCDQTLPLGCDALASLAWVDAEFEGATPQ